MNERQLKLLKALDKEIVEFLVEQERLPAFKASDPIDKLAEQLEIRLWRMQIGLESKFISTLRELGYLPSDPEQQRRFVEDLLGTPFYDMQNVIADTGLQSANIGRQLTFYDILRQGVNVIWTEFNQYVAEELRNRIYRFCEETFNNIKGDFANTLMEGYKAGIGIDEIAVNLRNDFANLRDWQLRRIARTEVNSAGSMGTQQTLIDYSIQYKQWITTIDERTRSYAKGDKADHIRLHGEVVRIDEPFSNGLMYPGDRNGPLEEFINCRCRHRAYIPRRGEVIVSTPYYPSR